MIGEFLARLVWSSEQLGPFAITGSLRPGNRGLLSDHVRCAYGFLVRITFK